MPDLGRLLWDRWLLLQMVERMLGGGGGEETQFQDASSINRARDKSYATHPGLASTVPVTVLYVEMS